MSVTNDVLGKYTDRLKTVFVQHEGEIYSSVINNVLHTSLSTPIRIIILIILPKFSSPDDNSIFVEWGRLVDRIDEGQTLSFFLKL